MPALVMFPGAQYLHCHLEAKGGRRDRVPKTPPWAPQPHPLHRKLGPWVSGGCRGPGEIPQIQLTFLSSPMLTHTHRPTLVCTHSHTHTWGSFSHSDTHSHTHAGPRYHDTFVFTHTFNHDLTHSHTLMFSFICTPSISHTHSYTRAHVEARTFCHTPRTLTVSHHACWFSHSHCHTLYSFSPTHAVSLRPPHTHR